MIRPSALLGSMALIALLVAGPASGQSVADVVDGMYAAQERAAQGINDYTIVQQVMGFETATYFEKTEVDGRTFFQPVSTGGAGARMGMGDLGMDDLGEYADALLEHGRYAGSEQIEGRAAHILQIDDVSVLELETPSGPDDMDFVPKTARIFVDADRYVPVRIEFDGEATTDTGVHEVTSVIQMVDYRDVQGLWIPHRTVITIEGISAMVDPETQAQLDEMMKQLEDMDPQQRAMMERMMGPQIEQMRNMLGGGTDAMTMEVQVLDVRVNAGPPGR